MFQRHFDDAQYESHRMDDLRKLRQDAVPMVFDRFDSHKNKRKKRKNEESTCHGTGRF